jgi:hypothetical protein
MAATAAVIWDAVYWGACLTGNAVLAAAADLEAAAIKTIRCSEQVIFMLLPGSWREHATAPPKSSHALLLIQFNTDSI